MNDQPLKECPKCGNEVRRLIFGGAGVIFKGSGFYITDKGKGTSETNSKPSVKKSQKSESSQSAPAVSSPCSECPKKGASASCQA